MSKRHLKLTSVLGWISPENETVCEVASLLHQTKPLHGMIFVFTTTVLFFCVFFYSVEKLNRAATKDKARRERSGLEQGAGLHMPA